MTPTASLLLPAPPFVSISDVRRLQFLPRGRRRPLLCWSGAEWGSVRTQMLSSFVGKSKGEKNPTFEWIALVVGFLRALLMQIFLHLMLLWERRTDFIILWRVNVGSRRSSRRSVICASLFGVGAPEALVIGVVALLVFGPKGLAEVNLRIQPCQLYSFCSWGYFTLYYCAWEVLEIEKHWPVADKIDLGIELYQS